MNKSSIWVAASAWKVLMLSLAIATLAASLLAAKPAHAAETFVVNNTGDPGDGNCSAALGCTLREAITAANATPDSRGRDIIRFDIPASGVQTIRPTSELPVVTGTVAIDGYTQPGAAFNDLAIGTNAKLLIELDGSALGSSADGLKIRASDSVVRGLVINRFGDTGIQISSSPLTDVTGVSVVGNFIGTDPTGTLDRGNGSNGVGIENADALVGDSAVFTRNLISGNGRDGVFVLGGSSSTVVNNLIGTEKDGAGAMGNADDGVGLSNTDNNFVGSAGPTSTNSIAFNGDNGVEILGAGSSDNLLELNSLFSNGGMGIDLNGDGPTANDPKDPDSGPNGLQNKPVLVSAVASRGKTTVRGRLSGKPGQSFAVLFFSNPAGNEAKVSIGQKFVATNAEGNASFSFRTPQRVAVGRTITATATSIQDGTSELSAPRKVTTP